MPEPVDAVSAGNHHSCELIEERECVRQGSNIEHGDRHVKIYVGNLPWSTTDSDLEELFGGFGPVTSAQVVTDRDSGRSRGFGFVEMEQADAERAIADLNGHQLESRQLRVNEANKREPRRAGGY